MKRILLSLLLIVSACCHAAFAGQALEELLASYHAEGAGEFSAERGKEMWTREFTVKGEQRSCASCHTADLTRTGKRADTGKKIDPMSPSVNPKRYQRLKHMKKWLKRNCKWTLGRICTPQEKGDYLTYLTQDS